MGLVTNKAQLPLRDFSCVPLIQIRWLLVLLRVVTAILVLGRISDALGLLKNPNNIEVLGVQEDSLLFEIVTYEAFLLSDGLGSAIYFL